MVAPHREARQTLSRLPGLVLICRRIRDYPIVALCLSSSESASFERAPETIS